MSDPHDPDVTSGFARFLHSEASGSIIMLACTIIALVWANSPWADVYFGLEHTYIGVSWADSVFKMSLGHWIGDGLMVIFFFVVGLEIKRELVVGQLSIIDQAVLPVSAAIGGMVVPASIYLAFNAGTPTAAGWGVPMATDIAFAIGILSLFGARAPIGLKIFLTALAIADDLGAVLVIALFYTSEIVVEGLVLAGVFMGVIVVLGRLGIRPNFAYILPMVVVWAGVLISGVHATVAGVLLAMLIPVRSTIEPDEFFHRVADRISHLEAQELTRESTVTDADQTRALDDLYVTVDEMRSPGLSLERDLHPVQAFVILPIFALFKAGITLSAATLATFPSLASLGVILGLVVGKPIGVLLFSWMAIRSGYARLPEGVTTQQLVGAGLLAGVGFTMSIFISELAFVDKSILAEVKLGILVASLIAGIVGFIVLHRVLPKAPIEAGQGASH